MTKSNQKPNAHKSFGQCNLKNGGSLLNIFFTKVNHCAGQIDNLCHYTPVINTRVKTKPKLQSRILPERKGAGCARVKDKVQVADSLPDTPHMQHER